MKELVHKIRQIFMSTRVIENRTKYQILCWGCVFIHFVFSVLMFAGNVYFLANLNIVATLFYVFLACFLAPREKYKLLFIVALFEVEVNATVSSIMLGDGYEFMVYTLSLIPGAFYLAHTWPVEQKKRYGISLLPLLSTLTVGFMYVLVDVLYSVIPPFYAGATIVALKPIFHFFNILVAVVLLLAFAVLFELEVRYIQKLLNDENSRLGEIAARDPLTKAYNRRSLYEIINSEINTKENLIFGLVILDIDDFKKVNDTYGHLAGDKVLVRVAEIMRENLREGDNFCRWGGEEFMIQIHGSEEECFVAAERIRSNICKQVFDEEERQFSITVTMGITVYKPGLKIRTLVEGADQKMYYGKNHGKNQVVR